MKVGTETFSVSFPRAKLPTKQRPRVTKRGTAYTPKATKEWQEQIRQAFLSEAKHDWRAFTGEVRCSIAIERPLSRSAPKRLIGTADLMAPDVDNLSKAFLDALNGTAYADDRQVTALTVFRARRGRYRPMATVTVQLDYFKEEEE